MLVAVLGMAISANAQEQSNYTGSSKFTDNVGVTVQYGMGTPFVEIDGQNLVHNVALIGVEKYINPVFGVGVEGRTVLGAVRGGNLSHTFVDNVNVSGYLKANVRNAIWGYDGERRFFEPVVYTGLGWGHNTCSESFDRNFMTYRAGVELNFNLGEKKAWAVVVNPAVVWGDIDNGKLVKQTGNFQVTAGVAYRFKTSNGTHSFAKPVLYSQTEIDELNAQITELRKSNDDLNAKLAAKPTEVVKEVEKIVYKPAQTQYVITFAQGKHNLTDAAKAVLDAIEKTSTVKVMGTASPEGTKAFNDKLSLRRAQVAAEYLEGRGVKIASVEGLGVTGPESNRLVIVVTE